MPNNRKKSPSKAGRSIPYQRIPVVIPDWQLQEITAGISGLVQDEHEKELKESYDIRQSLANQLYELTGHRDRLTAKVDHLEKMLLQREAQIGRLCIQKGIVQ